MTVSNIAVKYTGSTPGADANTYPLFTTVQAGMGSYFFSLARIARFELKLIHDQQVTLKWYRSDDRGSNWTQVGEETLAGLAAKNEDVRDYLVEGEKDWKLDLVNGGSAQTTWDIKMAMTGQRVVPV